MADHLYSTRSSSILSERIPWPDGHIWGTVSPSWAPNITVGQITGGGTTAGNYDLAGFTLTEGLNNASTTYTGTITSTGTATGSFTKTGSGTLTYNARSAFAYTGTTTISGGVISVDLLRDQHDRYIKHLRTPGIMRWHWPAVD